MDDANPILIDPEIMHGTPCFRGTRVPVTTLFDYLAAGDNLADFLDDFPTVKHEQAVAVLKVFRETVAQHARPA